MNWSDIIVWTDKQKEALKLLSNHRFLLYGGRRGGGKSHFLRWWLLQYLLELYAIGIRNARVMLGCESYPTLADRQISKINVEFPRWMGCVQRRQEDELGFFLNEEFGGGAILLRNLDDPRKYVGAEFAALGVDQIERVTKDVFDSLRGSLRWPGVEEPKFCATANPGGIGHRWVKALWIDRNFPPELKPLENEFVYLPVSPYDNPHLPESYINDLMTLPENLRKAWAEGDWEVLAGTAFPQFGDRHIIEPFEIPDKWVKMRGVDWGFSAPFACIWVAKNPDTGRYYIYRAMQQSGLTDRQQARTILEMTNETIHVTYADPSMWQPKNAIGIVTSTADEYAAEGVYLTKGDNNRLSGMRKIQRLLADLDDGLPGLQVFKTCKPFLNTFPYLVLDEKNPEDVDTDQEDDHLFDALKYALSGVTLKPVSSVKLNNPWLRLETI